MKKVFFCILKVTEDFGMDSNPDPLVIGMHPRIRIRILPKCHGSGTLLKPTLSIISLNQKTMVLPVCCWP